MMADRKRLGALALAQCASFAAVLILAAFSRPGPPPHRTATPSPSASPTVTFTVTASAVPAQRATPTATSKAAKPTPAATGTPSPSSFQNTPVVTLDAGTLTPVASGVLDSKDSAPETVPANHSYLVCLSLPQGWKSAGDTYRLPNWICVPLSAAATGEPVSFALTPASPSGAGGTG
jgi:hypothetical protein